MVVHNEVESESELELELGKTEQVIREEGEDKDYKCREYGEFIQLADHI